MLQVAKGLRESFKWKPRPSQADMEKRQEETRRWNVACAKYMIAGLDPDECRRRANAELGFPADYSPGKRV